MPGNPSIRIGSFKVGFSLMSIEQTMNVHFDGYLDKQGDIRMSKRLMFFIIEQCFLFRFHLELRNKRKRLAGQNRQTEN